MIPGLTSLLAAHGFAQFSTAVAYQRRLENLVWDIGFEVHLHPDFDESKFNRLMG